MEKSTVVAIITTLFFFATGPVHVSAKSEHDYQQEWCTGKAQMEKTMPDRTRCDCLTDTHAIEFKFAKEWMDAIGQSLNYSFQTGKKAGIVLIVRTPKERKYWIQLNSLIQHKKLDIDTWKIEN